MLRTKSRITITVAKTSLRILIVWPVFILSGVIGMYHLPAQAQSWNVSGNSISGSDIFGTQNNEPLRIYTNGSEHMRLTPAGDVGIGLTAPANKLHVFNDYAPIVGQVVLSTISLEAAMPNFNYEARWDISSYATGSFGIGNYNYGAGSTTERISIDADGNVGLGNVSPQTRLHILGGSDVQLASAATGYLMLGNANNINLVFDENEIMARNNGAAAALHVQAEGGDFSLHSQMAGDAPKFIVEQGGNVGIGTLTPSGKLDVRGDIHLTGDIKANEENSTFNIFANSSDADGPYFKLYGRNHLNGGSGEPGRISIVAGEGAGGIYFLHKNSASTWKLNAVMTKDGYMGLGTDDPDYELDVAGTIRACEVLVSLSGGWCDYVFDESYELAPLEQVEAFIQSEKHLPDIPPASELEHSGLNVADMQARMMRKIEELTLYVIELHKDAEARKHENTELRQRLENMENGQR